MLIIDGHEHDIPGLVITDWRRDKRLARGQEDGRLRRTRWVRSQINHTTKGLPGGRVRTAQHVKPGGLDKGKEFDVAKYWSGSPKSSGAHLIIDTDGSIGQTADLLKVAMYHAGPINEVSIGHEMYQMSDGGIYEMTLETQVHLNIAICQLFGMQFQIHRPYKGAIPRLSYRGKGRTCVGVFGHHDVTNNRGEGDPGEIIKDMLVEAGAEAFDFERGEDLEVWKERQKDLGVLDDGIPGPQTVVALKAAGFKHGVWAFGKEAHDDSNLKENHPFRRILCAALGCD